MANDDQPIDRIIERSKVVAVVGVSRDPAKPSNEVASYLINHGYEVIPVNPTASEVLGLKCYPDLASIPIDIVNKLDIVDIFRPSEQVGPVVDQAIQLKKQIGRPLFIWMQLGISNEPAAIVARRNGIDVVMDRCLMVESRRRGR